MASASGIVAGRRRPEIELDTPPGPAHHWSVRTYGQYCPLARASEILASRWTPLVIRNLMFGADTFSAIASGVPQMSRSMLVEPPTISSRACLPSARPISRTMREK